jgi:hypothetical protein
MPLDTNETIYIGTVVKLAATGGVEEYDITDASFFGVSLEYGAYDATNTTASYLICIDPNAQYQVQVENGGTFIEQAEFGQTFDVTGTGGTGLYSSQELEDAPAGTQANGPFIVLGLVRGPEPGGGVKPTVGEASQEAIVKPNIHNMTSALID